MRRIEESQHHCDDLGLHLPDAGEDIGMDGIGDSELAESLRLELDEVCLTVVDGARDISILPPRVVHIGERLELRTDGIVGEPLLGQGEVASDIGRDHLGFELGHGFIDLLLDLAANARRAEEVAIEDPSDGGV